MPELPEVETIRTGLERHIVGRRIEKVQLLRANLRTPFPANLVDLLSSARINSVRRRAKYLLADLDNDHVWLSHLGMSGSFRTYQGQAQALQKHDHVHLTLEGNTGLIFNDPRRFGLMDIFPSQNEQNNKWLAHLGLEPLSNAFNAPAMLALFKNCKAPIKTALMNQKYIVGVGNIYACEALFMAGIHPERPAMHLSKADAQNLVQAVQTVLNAALRAGGSTLRDHRQLEGDTGYFQHSFLVYGHKNKPCPCAIGTPHAIHAMTQAGRTTFYCPVKQR